MPVAEDAFVPWRPHQCVRNVLTYLLSTDLVFVRNFDFSVLCFGAQHNHFHQWRREEVKAARSFQGQKIVRHVINSNSADPKGQSPGPEGSKNEACMRAGCHMGDSCKIPSGSGAHPQLPWRPRNFVTEGTLCVRKNRSVRPGALWCIVAPPLTSTSCKIWKFVQL